MAKNTVAVLLGCLYVAVSSWIVSSQGKAHRNELRHAKEQIHDLVGTTAGPDREASSPLTKGPAALPEELEPVEKTSAPSEPLTDRSGDKQHSSDPGTGPGADRPRLGRCPSRLRSGKLVRPSQPRHFHLIPWH